MLGRTEFSVEIQLLPICRTAGALGSSYKNIKISTILFSYGLLRIKKVKHKRS